MRRVIVLNAKGGCGKSTLATNLASQYAALGYATALFDYDPQGSSMAWLAQRSPERPTIHGVPAWPTHYTGLTRSWRTRTPPDTQRMVIDTPAGLSRPDLNEHLHDADRILIPVQPSPMDIRAAADFIRDLLLISKLRLQQERIAIVANRTRENTHALHNLERFLARLQIPLAARLRDTQSYVHAAEQGLGVHELDQARARKEQRSWQAIMRWLEREERAERAAQRTSSAAMWPGA